MLGTEGQPVAVNPRVLYEPFIQAAAQQYGVRPELIRGVITTESSWNPNARAKTTSASGLMQMTKAACQTVGFDWNSMADPQTAIMAGTAYLAWCIGQMGGDEQAGVQAYFEGVGNARKGDASPLAQAAQVYSDKVYSNVA